jgi:hypothetical protein
MCFLVVDGATFSGLVIVASHLKKELPVSENGIDSVRNYGELPSVSLWKRTPLQRMCVDGIVLLPKFKVYYRKEHRRLVQPLERNP